MHTLGCSLFTITFVNILEKGNYRPVSVLPTISKFVERAIFDQLTDFFNFHFHPSLSVFRKGVSIK
jgi:hypothetical protein